jgi:hypothetical protein
MLRFVGKVPESADREIIVGQLDFELYRIMYDICIAVSREFFHLEAALCDHL